ncbi:MULTISPECIES: diaminopimelate decarboxylase [unclassified Pseudomonas]|uniref:diaminopimelate decarboxylase n=1 Tax=unclassified Pseudomonas TaxID=196821 RepID=UPI000812B488|nr:MULTISPECIES: diaminopimelate decarboxylase [unclassified Pseudomonas]CRL98632.1 L-glutamyl-[BtrI acyl-carrier protein] decarboxylase [Pseudomonas sp. 24 R 17]CRM31410.1 L-glutamyl-[BtrI acyl-carrier protein] decarboxylase [Pseudomonas sp. 52 E 6]CRM67064.1 L-glutamyl-[BtrI acyl-carrier protein] decarboxylase [Pseudomonas sp. 58 R 12]
MSAFAPDSRYIHTDKIENISYQLLADYVPTPFYAYSATQIKTDFAELKRSLPHDIDYFYSLKANPNKTLVALLHEAGTGCEVCSLVELEIALRQGVAPSDIIFVGPGKHINELTQCCLAGIKAVVVESIEEMRLLNDIAAGLGVIQNIALRINPDFTGEKAKLVMSGKPRQFGIDEQLLPQAFALLGQLTQLRLAGIHIYLGTRILDWQALANNTQNILTLAATLQQTYEIALDFVDVGGGFGVRYFDKEKALDLPALGEALLPLVNNYRQAFPHCRIVIELGRFLIARAGIFVTRVNYLKPSREEWFAVCDGGANCHGSAAGINSLIRRNFPMARLGPSRPGDLHRYQVTGPLCTPTDLLGENIMLAELRSGDLIGIAHSGAYGASASPVGFLSFGHPAEVLVENDQAFLIRTADSVDTMLAPQVCQRLSLAKA